MDEAPDPSWDEQVLGPWSVVHDAVLTSSTDAISIVRMSDGIFLYVNEVFCARSGYERDEVIGHPYHEFEFWADEGSAEALASTLAAEGSISGFVAPFHSRTGLLWSEVSARVLEIQGEPCVLSSARDLTGQRSVENELSQRQAILDAVTFAAGKILDGDQWEDDVDVVLAGLGVATGTDRVRLYRNVVYEGELGDWPQAEFTAPGVRSIGTRSSTEVEPYGEDFHRWVQILGGGDTIQGHVQDLPEPERPLLESEDIRSILAVPVFVDETWWGYLQFDACELEVVWSDEVIAALHVAASMMAAVLRREGVEQKLHDSEVSRRRVLESIPGCVYIVLPDDASSDVYISPRYEEMFGIPLSERLDNPDLWLEFTHPGDIPAVLAELERSRAEETTYLIEYRVRPRGETEWRWIHDEAVLVRQADGAPEYWFGLITEVTRAKKIESALVDAEARYQALVEQVPVVTYRELVPDGTYSYSTMLYMSPQVERMLGYSLLDFDGDADRFWEKAIHPEDRERVFRHSSEAVTTGREYVDEYRLIAQDGTVHWIHDESLCVGRDMTGAQIWHGVMMEVTERREAEDALRAAEGRYRNLIENIPAVVYIDREDADSGLGWNMVYVSPQIEEMLGFPAADWLESDLWLRRLHPDDAEEAVAYDKLAVSQGVAYSSEYRLLHADGHSVWIREEASVLSEDVGVTYWQGILTDVSDRKDAERELVGREAILRVVSDAAESFLKATSWEPPLRRLLATIGSTLGVDRAYLFQNLPLADGRRVTTQTHEWTSDPTLTLMGDPRVHDISFEPTDGWAVTLSTGDALFGPTETFDPQDQPELEAQGIRSLAIVPVLVDEQWWGFLGVDDCSVPREWRADEIEGLRTAAGILSTAVARQNAEDNLRGAEERFRLLVERTPAVVYVDAIDEFSTALYISPAVERLLGYTPEERLSDAELWSRHLHEDDREMVLAESRRTNETGDPFTMDYRMLHTDGHVVWVRDEAVLVRDREGRPQFWQGVLIDITERKDAEHELERALSLEREATERLRELDDMKNTFLTAVSHDLRTPLAAVLGLALTLEREDMDLEDAVARDLATRIASNARKLDRMVVDLLDLDRLTRGVMEPKLSRTDLGFLVRKVVEEADFLSAREVIVESDSLVATVDVGKVERIVENLLANAARHTDADTRIWVSVRENDEGVTISVADEGTGVEPELREAVFEPFRQGEAAGHQPSPGVGIGLSLVARFAELHGGRAWVDDREGGGAAFHVFLPSASSEVPLDRR